MNDLTEKGRLLIVDDSLLGRKAVSKIVDKAGFTFEQATNGQEALDKLQNSKFDLIITDLLMPHMSGIELATVLNSNYPELPFVVVTADIQDSSAKACREAGARAILKKPVKVDDLMPILESLEQERSSTGGN